VDDGEEPEPEPIERTLRVLSKTEGIRWTEADISPSADTDSNEERTAVSGQRIMTTLALCFRQFGR